jgi:hypothetical protein
MFAAADALDVISLDVSGATAVLHAAATRSTIEIFAPDGRLMHVAGSNQVELSTVRGAWTMTAPTTSRALLVLGMLLPGARLPLIHFWHRHRQVRGHLYRLNPFWLGEAIGKRLRLEVDDGVFLTTAKAGWTTGAVPLRQSRTRLTPPVRDSWETL